jgi:uncharacterized lipoprotein YddW (UPF0748 family)
MKVKSTKWIWLLCYFTFTNLLMGAAEYRPSTLPPPSPARELRGVWIASVSNIDWPSTNALSPAQQKAELLRMLDFAADLKLNAVFLQVRPACDALYASQIEPWSEYLTGQMGKPPEPRYDPLSFAIAEAHRRGLELHAWFNPYRARHPSAKSPVSNNHISRTKPQLVRSYGRHLWLDPGEKEVQEHSLRVVMDVVKRYDVDGVHFDDYFYPYRERDASGKEIDFPDDASWKKYGAGTGLSREDWRRENVNQFVQRVHRAVKQSKPWVKFGISPFGIWRPGNPSQIQGLDAYNELYADARKWLANGWVDYMAPQLYWAIDPPAQSFPVLLRWWQEQNAKNRMLWPGLNSANVGGRWKPTEIANQIRLVRQQAGTSGHIHWNMRVGLMRTNGLAATLRRELYQEAALPPALPQSWGLPTSKPRLQVKETKTGAKASWTNDPKNAHQWVLQWRTSSGWHTRVLPGSQRSYTWSGTAPHSVALSAVSRSGQLGPVAVSAKASTKPSPAKKR